MFVKCRPPRPAKKRPPQQRLKSPFYSLNQCFSWFQRTTIQFFFFFPSSLIQLGNIPFCGFSWTPAQHQVQIEKIPLANFSIGRPTVLSTEPLFQARSSDLRPWAHKSGVSLSSASVTHAKTPSLWWLPLQTPQPRGSDTSACVNLGICQGGKPEGFLADPTFKCSTVPGSDM